MKALVLAVFAAAFVYRLFLNRLSARSMRNPMPANVADVYDENAYRKWKSYKTERLRFDVLTESVTFVVELLLLLFNVHAAFAALFPAGWFFQAFAVVLLESLAGLLLLPLSYYDTMHIEEKYGFNRSTRKTFAADQAKEFLISLLVMTGIAGILGFLHLWLGDRLIAVFALVMFLLVLLISFLYPYFSRIFNRFTDLEDGELKEKLTALLTKHGFQVRAIQVMDASRRTSRSNAYFTGFGKTKTIVLYDTLVEAMTPDEICAVFAHEMGHGLHRDTLKNQALSIVQITVLAVMAWLVVRTDAFFTGFGFSFVNYGFALFLISTGFSLISPLWGLLTGWRSRLAEYAADAQAVEEGYGDTLIAALKKLARENLSDLSPSPLLVKLEYSHPTLSQRICAIEKRTRGTA